MAEGREDYFLAKTIRLKRKKANERYRIPIPYRWSKNELTASVANMPHTI